MARDEVTLTLDRAKAELARSLVDGRSTSEVVDLALDRLIRAERTRADVGAYLRLPPERSEIAGAFVGDAAGLDDDTEWDALYPAEVGEQPGGRVGRGPTR